MYCKNCGRQVPDQAELCVPCKAAMFDRVRAKYAQAVPNEAPVEASVPVVPVATAAPVVETPVPAAPVKTAAPVVSETPAETAMPATIALCEEEKGEALAPMKKGECGNAFAMDAPAADTEGKKEEAPVFAAEEAFGKGDSAPLVAEIAVAPTKNPAPRAEMGEKKPKKPVMRGFGKALAASILVGFGVGYAIVAAVYGMLYFIAQINGINGLPLYSIAIAVAVFTAFALGFSVPTFILSLQSIRLFLRAKKEEPRPLPYPAFAMGIYSLVGSAIAFFSCFMAILFLLLSLI